MAAYDGQLPPYYGVLNVYNPFNVDGDVYSDGGVCESKVHCDVEDTPPHTPHEDTPPHDMIKVEDEEDEDESSDAIKVVYSDDTLRYEVENVFGIHVENTIVGPRMRVYVKWTNYSEPTCEPFEVIFHDAPDMFMNMTKQIEKTKKILADKIDQCDPAKMIKRETERRARSSANVRSEIVDLNKMIMTAYTTNDQELITSLRTKIDFKLRSIAPSTPTIVGKYKSTGTANGNFVFKGDYGGFYYLTLNNNKTYVKATEIC